MEVHAFNVPLAPISIKDSVRPVQFNVPHARRPPATVLLVQWVTIKQRPPFAGCAILAANSATTPTTVLSIVKPATTSTVILAYRANLHARLVECIPVCNAGHPTSSMPPISAKPARRIVLPAPTRLTALPASQDTPFITTCVFRRLFSRIAHSRHRPRNQSNTNRSHRRCLFCPSQSPSPPSLSSWDSCSWPFVPTATVSLGTRFAAASETTRSTVQGCGQSQPRNSSWPSQSNPSLSSSAPGLRRKSPALRVLRRRSKCVRYV